MLQEVEFSEKTCPNCGKTDREVTLYADGTCSACGAPRSETGMIIQRSVFVCPHCGRGSIDFEVAFPGGACNGCGHGAGEVGILASAEKVRIAGKFALVMYAGDAVDYGHQIEKLLQSKGVAFLNVNDLYLRDVDVAFREKAMEYFVEKATRVFVVVSPGVGEDKYLSKMVEYVVYNNNPFPLMTPLGGWEENVFFYLQKFQYVDIEDVERIVAGITAWFKKNLKKSQ